MDISMDISMDIHMDMSMDTSMEMPIKSNAAPPAPVGAGATTRVPKADGGGERIMRKRSSKGGGAQRSIQVHLIAADVILTALAVWAMRNGR